MFSTALYEAGPAKGTRSSRRRQRPTADVDSLAQQPKAKRQRVPLDESTLLNSDASVKAAPSSAAPDMFEVKLDKIDLLGLKRDGIGNNGNSGITPSASRDLCLSVRSKKPKAGERMSKGDGSVILTTNNAYTVSKLPALPDRIRADVQNRQHGAILPNKGYALSLTHTHALVWPYTATTPSPETFTFALPSPSKDASDPLPLGSLVAPSTSTDDPGLVVVMPKSGRITYWDSISSAATFDFLRQQKSGIEDTIHGMFSGEYVVQIVNAESAGFVLAMNSGRLTYMSVRDGHGRPAISTQFLRSGLGGAMGGFLGSLRRALSSSPLGGEIAAVRSDQSKKIGERVIVAVTNKGKFHLWKIARGGHHEALGETDMRERALEAIHLLVPEVHNFPQDSFQVLDFAFVPCDLEKKYANATQFSDTSSQDEHPFRHVLALTSLSNRRQSRYLLVEVVLNKDGAEIGTLRPINCYTSPARATDSRRPRIYLPRPALVAFAVFDRAVVLASMTAAPGSSDLHLRPDSHIFPSLFEDVIDLRDDENLQIIGSGMEEPLGLGASAGETRGHRHKTKNPTAVLLVQGVGTIRISISDVERFVSETPPKVTAKSKLEQAVFFGIKDNNPLVFQGLRDLPFSKEEIGNAATLISQDIMTSQTPFIANLPASLGHNLRTRGSYLEKLMTYLNALRVDLDECARWALLFDAEKTAVATWIWRQTEEFIANRPADEKKNLTAETIDLIREKHKKGTRPAVGEVDSVRQWFINDISCLDIFINSTYDVLKNCWTKRLTDDPGMNRLVYEAVTINIGALREAHAFRTTHCRLYGVDGQHVPAGEALIEPWTATESVTKSLKRLIEFCHQWLNTYCSPEAPTVTSQFTESIRKSLPALTRQYFQALTERIFSCEKSDDPAIKSSRDLHGKHLDTDWVEKIWKLKDYELWDEAIDLAREYEVYEAMAQVMVAQITTVSRRLEAGGVSVTESWKLQALVKEKEKQMGDLIDNYEDEFAFPAFHHLLDTAGVLAVLDFPYGKKFKTKFLRTRPELAKVSWINDIERENDMTRAAETLVNLGTREQKLWNKKIEFSLGKLALLAQEAEEKAGAKRSDDQSGKVGFSMEKIDVELDVIRIQDDVCGQLMPSISDAVDKLTGHGLAMEEYGVLVSRNQKTLRQVLQDALTRLLKHEALNPLTLIDLLTLVYVVPRAIDSLGDLFHLALKVAELCLAGETREKTTKLIWRRCFIRDDWCKVNDSCGKNDKEMLDLVGRVAMYRCMYFVCNDYHNNEKFWPVFKPSDCLGVYTDKLDSRFQTLDQNFRENLLDSMKFEDAQLKKFIDQCQLEKWYFTVLGEAQREVARQLGVAQIGSTEHVITEEGRSIIVKTKELVDGDGNGAAKTTGKALFGNFPEQ